MFSKYLKIAIAAVAFVLISLFAFVVLVAGYSPTHRGAALIAEAKAATGGNAWDRIQVWHVTTTVGGRQCELWRDFRSLKFRATCIKSGYRQDAFFGDTGFIYYENWKLSGGEHESASERAGRELFGKTLLYAGSFGFFFPDRFPSTMTYINSLSTDGTRIDVVRIVPMGMDSMDVWIDHTSHRVVRIKIIPTSGDRQFPPFFFSDYRTVEGALLPHSIGEGNRDTYTFSSSRFDRFDAHVFALPQFLTIRLKTGGTVSALDFMHNGETHEAASSPGWYYLGPHTPKIYSDSTATENPPYLIGYIAATQYFNIVLLQEPLAQTRQQAEQYLMLHLGISRDQMCQLDYQLGVPNFVDRNYAGMELGFSFCPSAVTLPPSPSAAAPGTAVETVARYERTACGSISDRNTGLQWYIGPDTNMTWPDAVRWVQQLQSCGGGWSMPDVNQLAALFDSSVTAGTGYFVSGKYWPAHISPLFSGIGHGSWVWGSGRVTLGTAPAFNFNQGKIVGITSDEKVLTVRTFAVKAK